MKTNFNLKPEILILRLAELGLDESEIIHSLGLKRREFEKLKENKKISTALEKGQDYCTHKVEQALYSRAVGFDYEETATTEKPEKSAVRSRKSEEDKPETERCKTSNTSSRLTIKKVIPDINACIFWLKNRRPDKWRDPKDIDSSGKKSIQDLVEEYAAKGFKEDS
jgi:hypothetical protein